MLVIAMLRIGGADAAVVRMDLIGGLGEFERSRSTSWQRATSTDWPWGTKDATPLDAVAPGWSRLTGYDVVPEVNTIYEIERGTGIGGSNAQHFALKGLSSGINWTDLIMRQRLDDGKLRAVHHGDTLTFRVDRIFMSDFNNLPAGTSVDYKLTIRLARAGKNTYSRTVLTPSAIPFAAEVSASVEPGTDGVCLQVQISANGNLGARKPGIHIDGARLYVKRGSNDYLTDTVPAPRERNINTAVYLFNSKHYDCYEAACAYDAAVMQCEDQSPDALRLKYYNPNMKVYLYECAGNISDWRELTTFKDGYWSNCPIGFDWILTNKPPRDSRTYAERWLYPLPSGVPLRAPGDQRAESGKVDYVFALQWQNQYYAHVADSEYQRMWGERAVSKATGYQMDGIFMDGLDVISYKASDNTVLVDRKPYEIQSFLHSVAARARAAGLETLHNHCAGSNHIYPGKIFLDPFWQTTADYPAPNYSSNTPESTPDTFFQEYGFFPHYVDRGVNANHYRLQYWLDALQDMDTVVEWNRTLPASVRKKMHMMVLGVDTPQDPMDGQDGWAKFGLCSYLLAQSECSWFCIAAVGADRPFALDFGVTKRLGNPLGARVSLAPDQSLQSRNYDNGIVLANGHPTQSGTYQAGENLVDEKGVAIPAGFSVVLPPHSGRILFRPTGR